MANRRTRKGDRRNARRFKHDQQRGAAKARKRQRDPDRPRD
jgi:hypothetical protein